MKLEDQVCSLDLAKRLKELGVRQESIFDWVRDESSTYPCVTDSMFIKPYNNFLASAFTVAELGEMLPGQGKFGDLKIFKSESGMGDRWSVYYSKDQFFFKEFSADTEANARAKMLIYLIEQGIVKPDEEGKEDKQ